PWTDRSSRLIRRPTDRARQSTPELLGAGRKSPLCRPPFHDHGHPLGWGERDASPHDPYLIPRCCTQLHAAQHLGEHDLHLHQCKGHSETAPHTASEGKELVWGWLLLEEAVGTETLWLRPTLGTAMREIDARRSNHASGQIDFVDPQRASQPPAHERDD